MSRRVSRRQNRSHRRTNTWLGAEQLEPRRVLDARVLITEIVADNGQGLRDEDNERVDWLEIYNAGDSAADLSGWGLSDDAEDRTKWTFPAVTLEAEEYLVVYASGKDRRDPAAPLHTNFQLSSKGEYLGLVKADGMTVASEYAAEFPAMQTNRAYGIQQEDLALQLVNTQTNRRTLVPTTENGGDSLGMSWTDPAFDDASWIVGIGGVGFDAGTGYEDFIGTDLEAEMFGVNTSAFMRMPFTLDNPQAVLSMQLRMRYDDGYVAYLNGVEISRRKAPDTVEWNSEATTNNRDSLAKKFEDNDITEWVDLLRPGNNVLAIHGMNSTPSSDDFLIDVELTVELPGEITSETGRFFQRTTPGRPNGLVSYLGLVEPVTVSAERGFYEQSFDMDLTTKTPGATLVYTTDGSVPTLENGTVVPPPSLSTIPVARVNISKTTTFRSAAFKDGYLTSSIDTQSYIMLSDVLTQDFQSTLDAGFPDVWRRTPPDYGLDPKVVGPNDEFDGEFSSQMAEALKAAPTISIVTDLDNLFGEDGIYVNSIRSGADWERPTSFEFIDPDGSVSVQSDAGIRIQGDNVRTFSNSKKQSFRLEFREKYGPTKLRFPVFGDEGADSFDTIVLRGGYNDAWTHTPGTTQYIRDQWARTTLLAMGRPQVHGRFVHVYLNGVYWGLYNMVERPNASFSSTYVGGDKDEWDTLNTGRVRNGDRTAWAQLLGLARDVNDQDQAASNAAYLRLLGRNPDGTQNDDFETLIDVDNYIDYLIVNFYGGNTDWPGRNYYVGRQRGPESTGFKFYDWDAEKILDHGEGSTLRTNQVGVSDGVAAPYASLRKNEEFQLLFADHLQRHFFNGGELYVDPDNPEWNPDRPDRNVPAARYNEIAQEFELPSFGESARWGDTESSPRGNDRRTYTPINWRRMRDRLFDRYFPERSAIVMSQFVRVGLYPDVAAPAFNQHGGSVPRDFQLNIAAPGDVYYTLDGSDPRRSALDPGATEAGISATAIMYDGSVTLGASAIVKARTLIDGVWSALNEATFTVGASPLRISEVMYNPSDPSVPGKFVGGDFEFIELVNISDTESVDLEGIAFTDGIEFVFPQATLAPGERVVVVRNQEAFVSRYGPDINVAGQYGGTDDDFRLSNGGESLQLVDSLGTVIQEFSYDDSWVPSTDGDGDSLTVVDATADLAQWNQPENWRASFSSLGSPGADDVIDLNGDGLLDVADIDLFCEGQRASDLQFDLNGDLSVDLADLRLLIEDVFGTTFGDANLDGVFESGDLIRVLESGEYEDTVAGNSTWSDGDWDCDGDFTSRDIVLAFVSGGYVSAAAAPSTPTPFSPNVVAAALADDLVSGGEQLTKQDDDSTGTGPRDSDARRKTTTDTPTLVYDSVFSNDDVDWSAGAEDEPTDSEDDQTVAGFQP